MIHQLGTTWEALHHYGRRYTKLESGQVVRAEDYRKIKGKAAVKAAKRLRHKVIDADRPNIDSLGSPVRRLSGDSDTLATPRI